MRAANSCTSDSNSPRWPRSGRPICSVCARVAIRFLRLTYFSRLERLEPAHSLFLVGDVAAQEADQELELLAGVGGERVAALAGRAVELCGHLAELGCHLDEHAAAVFRVAGSAREASLFEAVKEGGHRGRAE